MEEPGDLARWEKLFEAHLGAAAPGDPAHDLEHLRRVVANARRLADLEAAPLEVVIPAAWLHDCVAVPKNHPARSQASRLSAERAVELLGLWGYPEAALPEIAHAIEAHSYTAGIPARTAAARVVQDADRLDALGATGLARCLALGGAWALPLYHPSDPFCRSREPNDSAYSLDHLFAKLLKLAAGFQTASGRAEAERRTAFLRAYLAELERELGEPITG